jgi:LysM repeat protein
MDNGRQRQGSARQRQQNRQQREMASPLSNEEPSTPRSATLPFTLPGNWREIWLKVLDTVWYLRHHTPILKVGGGLTLIIGVLFLLSIVFSPTIGYNVWSLGVRLDGKSVDDAQTVLKEAWANDMMIDVVLQGEVIHQIRPSELGLQLDAYKMGEQAKDMKMQGFPFGVNIAPIVTAEFGTAQTYLLNLVNEVYIPTYEAGFAWENGNVVALAGRPSRELDLMLTLENLTSNPVGIVKSRRLDLLTTSTAPQITDASEYLDEARAFLSEEFKLIGYDPFTDSRTPWTSTREEIARWLVATPSGLGVRESTFEQFIEAVNSQLATETKPRYLDKDEALEQLSNTLSGGGHEAYLRIRYTATTMELASGDWGQRIARRTGIPFRLIEEVNQGVNWDFLLIGQVINLPSRDLLLPETPLPNKRIIVDLDRRYMVAYEDGQVVMSWRVSIGREDAPTYPGIFQVLTHNETAYGSGFSLCGDRGCSQWEMKWFMGIYEVFPGLMNGFHGAVVLPNGAYLDDGAVGNASTFGCVMANDEQSQQLYEWADRGTIVEIVSSEFPPESELGRQAMEYISANFGA